jgi:hypothetical protein
MAKLNSSRIYGSLIVDSTINGVGLTSASNAFTLTSGSATLVRSGAHALTLTTSAASNVTFPTTGTLATTGNLSQFASTTSAQLAGIISDETGSGALVFANTPTLVTPILGAATATSINKVTITAPATSSTLTIANGKTLTVNESITLAGDAARTLTINNANKTLTGAATSLTFAGNFSTTGAFTTTLAQGANVTLTLPTTNSTLATTGNLSQFASTTSAQLAGVISDETGTGALVFATSPTFTTSVVGGVSFNVFDTTSTTINAFGAATSLNLGHDGTSPSTTNLAAGATASGSTKTINIGTGGVAGSLTNVNIGSQNDIVERAFTLTDGSVVITGSNTTNIVVGQSVSGPGIPNDTNVVSLVASTSVTISNAATAGGLQTLKFGGTKVTIAGALDVIGNTNLRGKLTVEQDADFRANVNINGSLNVVEKITAGSLSTKLENNIFYLREGATEGLDISGASSDDWEYTGVLSRKADGTYDIGILFDGFGTARVGALTQWMDIPVTIGSGAPTGSTPTDKEFYFNTVDNHLYIYNYNTSTWAEFPFPNSSFNPVSTTEPVDPELGEYYVDTVNGVVRNYAGESQAIATRADYNDMNSYGVAYWDASKLRFENTSSGTSGQVLRSNGSSPPTFQNETLNIGASNSTSKLFLVGRTAQSTGVSNSNSNVYTTNGTLFAPTFAGGEGFNGNLTIQSSTNASKGIMTLDANTVVINADLTINGTTTTLNTNTLTVDDKNIELGSVVAKTGLIATLATGTNIVTLTTGNTNGMIPGQLLTKTSGTGAFGADSRVGDIINPTVFIVVNAAGADLNHTTAGSITFSTQGASDASANGGGITLKGTTDKTFNWLSTTGWTSNQNLEAPTFSGGTITLSSTSPTLTTTASGAKTANFISNTINATATSSTTSVTKTGLSIQSTGTWNGTSAVNRALLLNATGGTINRAIEVTAGDTVLRGLSITAAATGSVSTQIPVFIADPASTTRTLVTRTPAQLRSDIGAGTGNGTVTGVTATSPIASSGGTAPVISHVNSGVTAGSYNNVTVNATGHVTAGSNVSYLTSFTESDTLASVTGRGATTGTAISLTNATASTSTSTGALVVTGGVGVGGNLNVGGTAATTKTTIANKYSIEYNSTEDSLDFIYI